MTPSTTPLIVHNPAGDPVDDEAAAADAIRRVKWFQALGRPDAWPVTTEDAATLLHDGGLFDTTAEDLERLVTVGVLPPPAEGEDGPEWNASDVMEAARVLEFRRQWQFGTVHDAKRLTQELIMCAARKNDEVAEIADALRGNDLLGLLQDMVVAESREVRLMKSVVFRLLLEAATGVRV